MATAAVYLPRAQYWLVRWAPHYQRTLLALLAVVLVAQPVHAHGGEEGDPPERDILWFRHISVAYQFTNFTTHPPSGEGYTHPPVKHTERGSWSWRTTGVPERWEVPAGTELVLVAYVSGLDQADILYVPSGDRSRPLGVAFEAELWGPYGHGTLARGEHVLPVDPLDPPAEIVRVEIPLVTEEGAVFGDEDPLQVDLHVYGRGRKYTPLRLHIQGEDAATHLVAPGFPVDAFRAWEESMPLSVCIDHKLRGDECVGYWDGGLNGRNRTAQDEESTGQRHDAGVGGGLAVAGVGVALGLAAWRRRST